MDVVVVFTAQGQIIGERISQLSVGPLQLKNPCIMVPNDRGVNFIPLGNFVKGKVFTVNPDMMLFKEPSEPIEPILNKFKELYGGIPIYGASSIVT